MNIAYISDVSKLIPTKTGGRYADVYFTNNPVWKSVLYIAEPDGSYQKVEMPNNEYNVMVREGSITI